MKILAAIDNSPHSEAVVEMLASRVWPEGSVISLMTVIEKGGLLSAISATAEDRALQLAQQHLADIVRDLSVSVVGVKFTPEVIVGHVKETLIQAAERWPAELIVVGCHGKQQMDILRLGSVSQSLLHHAPCPVLIAKQTAPKTIAGKQEFKILAPVDHSQYSQAALEWLLNQHWRKEVKFELLTVLPSIDEHYSSEADPEVAALMLAEYEKYKEENLNLLRQWSDKIKKAIGGCTVGCDVLSGEPRQLILAAAQKWPADLIVMGSHGRSGLTRFVLGSISQGVSLHSQCSIEIVRHRQLIEKPPEDPGVGFPRERRDDQDRIPHIVW